jgi:hypothetical protein
LYGVYFRLSPAVIIMSRSSCHRYWPLALVLGLLASMASAQVGLMLETDRKTYVQFEAAQLRITVRNASGNTLDFGPPSATIGPKDPLAEPNNLPAQGKLSIEVLSPRGENLTNRRPDFNPALDLILPAGATRSVDVPLALLFDLTNEGNYQVQVRASHSRFRSEYASPKVSFTVRGARTIKDLDGRLMSTEVGVPSLGTNVPIATRTASLFSFYTDGGDQCGLKIADDQYVYAIIRLGPFLRGTRPQLEIDSRSHIHAMLDVHTRLTGYWVYDLDGKQKQFSYYKFDKLNLARLLRDPDLGRVMVVGAEVAMEGIDYNLTDLPVMTMSSPKGGDLGDEWEKRKRPPEASNKVESAIGPEPGEPGAGIPRRGAGPLPPETP